MFSRIKGIGLLGVDSYMLEVEADVSGGLPAFDIVKEVNTQIKAYSPVFAGCNVLGVWHVGESIPAHTQRHNPQKSVSFLLALPRNSVNLTFIH